MENNTTHLKSDYYKVIETDGNILTLDHDWIVRFNGVKHTGNKVLIYGLPYNELTDLEKKIFNLTMKNVLSMSDNIITLGTKYRIENGNLMAIVRHGTSLYKHNIIYFFEGSVLSLGFDRNNNRLIYNG